MAVETDKAGILSWLDCDDWPGDVYQLLGRKRFDPDIAQMCDEVTAGAREVLPYQTHADPAKAMRAMRLLTEFVGRAADVFSSAEKVGEENDRLYNEIRNRWAADNGKDPSAWKRDALVMWLAEDADVHDKAVDDIAKVMPAEDQAAATKKSKVIHPEIGDDVAKPMMPIILDTPAAAAPVIIESDEPAAPAIIADPEPPAEAAAPVILPAAPIIEEPQPAAGRKRVFQQQPAAARSGERAKAAPPKRPDSKSGAHPSAKSGAHPATKPRPPKQPAAAARPKPEAQIEPAAEEKSKKPIALTAMMIGLPVLLLAAALIWKFYPQKSGDDSVASNDEKTQKTDDTGIKTKTSGTPIKTTKVGPVVKTQTEKYNELMARAHRAGRGAPSRKLYLQALDLATTTTQKAMVYAGLGFDYEYTARLDATQVRNIVELLTRDPAGFRVLNLYVSRIRKADDLKNLLNALHARIDRGEDRMMTEKSLHQILSNRSSQEVLTMTDTLDAWVRAYAAISDSTVKIAMPGSLPRSLLRRKKNMEAIKLMTARVKKSGDKAATVALLSGLVEYDVDIKKRHGTADVKAIYEAMAEVGAATTSSLRHQVLAKKLYAYAKENTLVDEVLKYFQERLKKNSGDKFSQAMVAVVVDQTVADALKLRGPARAAAVTNAWKLAGPGAARVKLAESILEDEEYIKQADFEQVLAFHEAVVGKHLGPSSTSSDYQKSVKVKALLRFAETNKKLNDLEKRYITQVKKPEKKIVAQAVLNEVSNTRVKAARPRLGSKWDEKDFMAIESALKHADAETISGQYDSLMTDIGFIRSLSFKGYLLTEEKVIAGSTTETKTSAALLRMGRYLDSLRKPAKNPAANRRAIIGRWRNARGHLLQRLKENKDNAAAQKMLKRVETALKKVGG